MLSVATQELMDDALSCIEGGAEPRAQHVRVDAKMSANEVADTLALWLTGGPKISRDGQCASGMTPGPCRMSQNTSPTQTERQAVLSTAQSAPPFAQAVLSNAQVAPFSAQAVLPNAPFAAPMSPTSAGSPPPSAGRKSFLDRKSVVQIFLAKHMGERDVHLSGKLAHKYGVTAKTVRDIWAMRTWTQVTEPFWLALRQGAASSNGW